MTGAFSRKHLVGAALGVVAIAIVYVLGAPLSVFGRAAVYLTLALAPGAAAWVLIDPAPCRLDIVLASILIGPLVTGAFGSALMLAGLSAGTTAMATTIVVGVVFALSVVLRQAPPSERGRSSTGRYVLLTLVIAVFCLAAGYLPLTRELWRQWSDAWFHGAVVAQIETWGLPPEDPYFAGMSLQYMWFYHVLLTVLSTAMRVDALFVPPLLNMQALAGFALCAFVLSRTLRRQFSYGVFAALTAVLAMNAGIWFFLPLKLIRALIGEVHGWEEIVRNFTLIPFDRETVTNWVTVFFNQTFLLNKFIVATAFSLGLCYMAALWYGGALYLSRPDRRGLTIIFASIAGMLLFHTLVAFIMVGTFLGTAAMLWLFRSSLRDYSGRTIVRALLAGAAAILLTAPYIYSVMHMKEGGQLFPISFSLKKSAGILISCGLVIALSAFQLRRLAQERRMAPWLLLLGSAVVFVFCNIIQLPASNTYDKLPFFVFFPLAVIGSWTFADRYSRAQASPRFRRRVAAVALLLLLPVNILLTVSYYVSRPEAHVDAAELRVAEWARRETRRDAVFFDSNDRVFLLVTGPRRYYWGRAAYAEQWGYPKEEMNRRRHARDDLYDAPPIDGGTFGTLAGIPDDVYVISRHDMPGYRYLAKRTDVFTPVFESDGITVFSVDRAACRQLAGPSDRGGSQ